MSRIVIRDPQVGDLSDIIDVNSTVNSWNNNSGDVESENIRLEGLDRRNFVKTDRRGVTKTFQVFGDVDILDYGNGAMGPYGVTAFGELGAGATRVHCGGFDVETGDKIIIHAGFHIKDNLAYGAGVPCAIRGTVGYKKGIAGAITQLPQTRRWFSSDTTANHIAGTYAICAVPSLPVETNYWFTLMFEITGGGASIEIIEPYIMAVRLRA